MDHQNQISIELHIYSMAIENSINQQRRIEHPTKSQITIDVPSSGAELNLNLRGNTNFEAPTTTP